MKYTNYININTDNLLFNIKTIKKKYSFNYYILDVSNNAFNHGMYLVNYINEEIDYLYVNNLNDVYLIRKYNKEIPIILNYDIDKDNILDIINNNVILIVNDLNTLQTINNIDLYSTLNIILNIDISGIIGFKEKFEIQEAIEIINNKKKLELIGIKALDIDEKEYLSFKYIANQLLRLDLKLYIFNNENDKVKIKNSNTIKLDYSIYGINDLKRKVFKKEKELKQVFNLYSKIEQIHKETKGKKDKYIGIIPYGYLKGMNDNINKVYINKKLYNIKTIKNEYMIIDIDESINIDDKVLITGNNNPLENYFDFTLGYFQMFNNLPLIYKDYELEKVFVY